jgi:hypothetical protein
MDGAVGGDVDGDHVYAVVFLAAYAEGTGDL